eukprot:SAG31_NODE_1737_length_7402_cov_28.696289_2_plen_143_part_00
MLCMSRLYDQPETTLHCLALIDRKPVECLLEPRDGRPRFLELTAELLALLISRDTFELPDGEAAIYEMVLLWAEFVQAHSVRGCGRAASQLAAPLLQYVRLGLLSRATLCDARERFSMHPAIVRRIDRALARHVQGNKGTKV